MTTRPYFIAITALVILYSLLFYFIFTHAIRIDYTCFYSGSKALLQGQNPYQTLFTTYFPTVKKVSLNLNPPIVLMLFSPLSKQTYSASLMLWSVISFILGLIAMTVSFKLAFTPAFLKKNKPALYLLYFAFYPALINTAIGQLGTFIACFMMVGYAFYIKKWDVPAAVMWGVIIAMKLFPGLLFCYVLMQRRYKVASIMAATILTVSMIPWLVYGSSIYSNYFSMLSHLAWYGDNWNASINGFLFRILSNADSSQEQIFLVKSLYGICFIGVLVWYLKQMASHATALNNHLPFCLTLVFMLLMSPFGWMYYFPLLVLPLCLTWSAVTTAQTNNKIIFTWIICLFFINFPVYYVRMQHMSTLMGKLTLHSFYFYGLCLLAYLLAWQMKRHRKTQTKASDNLLFPIQSIMAFGVVMLSIHFILRLTSHP